MKVDKEMKKIKLFEFENVSEDLKEIEKERRKMLTMLNVTEKMLKVLKAISIVIFFFTVANENLTLIQSFLWIITITASITVLLLFVMVLMRELIRNYRRKRRMKNGIKNYRTENCFR